MLSLSNSEVFLNQVKPLEKMDVPEEETMPNEDKVFLHFLYGFLVLLGISILISLGKAIYHFYKVRREHNVEPTDVTMATECHSISNEASISERPSENNVPDSERLRLQLDKLRRLLNRLNAMGTFSRDTIGDLSAESAVRINNSKAASSDMSEFWSSIDFDEFDDSTINDGKFGKTPTEKSVSPSISDYSLDTSGIPFDNVRHKNFATSSRENVLNVPSAFSHRTNPSDAILQILNILDSIMLKNRDCDRLLKKNTSKMEKTSDESLNSQALSEAVYPPKCSTSSQKLSLLPIESSNKKLYATESPNSDTVIAIPEEKDSEILNSDIELLGNMLSSKPKLLQQLSHTTESQCNVPSAVSKEAKISKVMSVVNISSCTSKKVYSTKMSSSSKSLGNKISISQSVSLCVDPFACLSTHAKEISKSVSAAPGDQYCKKVESKTDVAEISPCELHIEALHRSHSLSDLLDKTLLSIESTIEKSCSYEEETEIPNLKPERKSQVLQTLSNTSSDSEKYPAKNNLILDNAKSNSSQEINNRIFSSVSSKSLRSPLVSNSLTIKLSVSEPEIKQSRVLGVISPNLSSSGSDAFLSPLIIDISQSEKIDWKSPVELNSDTVVRNLTPRNENAATLSRKSFIWSTPPLPVPKEIVSDEIII